MLVLFMTSQLLLAGCEEKGPFSLTEERFTQILATKNSAAIVALPDKAFEDAGPMGPATWYYTARWLDALEPAGSDTAGQASKGGAGLLPGEPSGKLSADEDIPPALMDVGAQGGAGTASAAPGPRAKVRALYRLAFSRCSGLVQREAGLGLVAAAAEDARSAAATGNAKQAALLWNELLAETQDFGDRLGADPAIRLARFEALDALGRDAELVRECSEYRSLFPREADADALLFYEGASSRRLGKKLWAQPLFVLLVVRPTSDWTAKAYDFVSGLGASQVEIGPEVLAAAKMRLLVRDRDYGAAARAALRGEALIFSRSAPKALVADAGKAWLYSGSSTEGLERFARAYGDWPADRSKTKRSQDEAATAWTASYYRARFLRALEKWPEAAALFAAVGEGAPSPEDADAAAWYGLDCAMKAVKKAQAAKYGSKKVSQAILDARASTLRRSCLELMVDSSATWKDPSLFSDLADSLLREGIAARDWGFVAEFSQKLGPHLSPILDARSAYVAGLALDLRLDVKPAPKAAATPAKSSGTTGKTASKASAPPPAEGSDGPSLEPSPATFYLAAATRNGAPTYYRLLALHRLGTEAEILPPPGAPVAPQPAVQGGQDLDPAAELEAYLRGFVDLGLGWLAFPEIKARPDLDQAAVRRLALAVAAKGDYATSMRIILTLADRPDWLPTREDYELIYPRPYLDEIRAIRPRPDVPEYILYGLLRSESFFRPDVVSSAGAVGLAQLMPSTAEEIARGLGMKAYDLTKPGDNVRMGSAHFADLIDGTGGRPMRAMFAYNAGGGRLKRWLADYPGLPDDLLLEALPIEETRQYGRNILQAAVFYAELYYDMSGKDAIDGVLGAGARPSR
jgi:soluble lytic murein transglycosylase-like protein